MIYIYINILNKYLVYVLILFFISCCSGRIANHGVLNIEKHIPNIVKNNLEKAEIEALLGPPSTISAFEFNKWYYINNTIRHIAFYKPEIIDHKVYEIIFNKENQAIKINEYDQDDLNDIAYNADITETRGNQKPLLEYIFKGIGNSNINK